MGMLIRLLLWCDDGVTSIVCWSLQGNANSIYGGVNAACTRYVSIMSNIDGSFQLNNFAALHSPCRLIP